MGAATSYACFDQPESEKPKVDTNVLEFDLKILSKQTIVATGDPYFCENCACLLNAKSVLMPSDTFSI